MLQPEKKILTVRVESAFAGAVAERARVEERTVAQLMRSALRQYLRDGQTSATADRASATSPAQ